MNVEHQKTVVNGETKMNVDEAKRLLENFVEREGDSEGYGETLNWVEAARTILTALEITSDHRTNVLNRMLNERGEHVGSITVIRELLNHDDTQVRDAVAGELEHWGSQTAAELLTKRAEIEPEEWLAKYMRDVVRDIIGLES